MVSSSIPSSLCAEDSCNLLGGGGAGCAAPPRAGLPEPELVMVSNDHATLGSTVAFFKESMRREAMIGTRIVFALRNVSQCGYQPLEHRFGIKEGGDLHCGKERHFRLVVYRHDEHLSWVMSCTTYRGEEQKQQRQEMDGEYEYEVVRCIS